MPTGIKKAPAHCGEPCRRAQTGVALVPSILGSLNTKGVCVPLKSCVLRYCLRKPSPVTSSGTNGSRISRRAGACKAYLASRPPADAKAPMQRVPIGTIGHMRRLARLPTLSKISPQNAAPPMVQQTYSAMASRPAQAPMAGQL